MEDLWPDFKGMAPFKTPISIIKEHASKLEEKTNYMISADVEKDDTLGQISVYDNKVYKDSLRPPFQYTFYLIAEALSYRYKLFCVAHDIFLYPIYLYGIDKDIKDEFYPEQGGAMCINNEKELLVVLKNIFMAKKTVKVIQALLSQVS